MGQEITLCKIDAKKFMELCCDKVEVGSRGTGNEMYISPAIASFLENIFFLAHINDEEKFVIFLRHMADLLEIDTEEKDINYEISRHYQVSR